MINKPCSKCGSTCIPKAKRKHSRPKKDGTKTIYKRSVCIMCVREENREWYHRNRENRLKSIKIWKDNNIDKVNFYRRKTYQRKKYDKYFPDFAF